MYYLVNVYPKNKDLGDYREFLYETSIVDNDKLRKEIFKFALINFYPKQAFSVYITGPLSVYTDKD